MRHGVIVTNQNVPNLPGKAQADTVVIQQGLNDIDDGLLVIVNGDFAGRELGLRGVPGIVEANARDARLGVVYHQRQPVDIAGLEPIIVH